MDRRDRERIERVCSVLGLAPRDPALILQGITHNSHLDPQADDEQRRRAANERLEFLGDALLGAAAANLLYRRHPQAGEGTLSRLRAQLVSRRCLARGMERIGLLDCCRVGASVPTPWPDSVKANLAEGLLGAIYRDLGWDAVIRCAEALIEPFATTEAVATAAADSKNRLQEWSLAHTGQLPHYDTVLSGGSAHAPEFTATATAGAHSAAATGTSRRRAEAAAAARLFEQLTQS